MASNMIGLVYGHFASNLGDIAITKGVAQFLGGMGKQFCFLAPPMSDVGRRALEKLEADLGKLDIRPADSQLESPLRRRKPEQGTELGFLDDVILQPDAILARNNIGDCDTLVFMGGEHLFSSGSSRDIDALAGRLVPCLAGIAAGRKVICLPSTFGPYKDALSRCLVRTFLKGCSAAAVREPASLEHIASLGPDVPQLPLFLDSAFLLQPPTYALPDEKLINVVVRLDQFGMRLGGPMSNSALRAMRESSFAGSASINLSTYLITELLRTDSDARVQMLVQTDSDQEVANEIAKRIQSQTQFPPERLTVSRPATIDAFLLALSRGQCTVSSRFHAIIFSALVGRPSLGVHFPEHGHKIPGLMSLLGLAEFSFDGKASQAADVAAALTRLVNKAGEISQELTGRVAQLRSGTESWMRSALSD